MQKYLILFSLAFLIALPQGIEAQSEPIANFSTHTLSLVIGGKYNMKVLVNNPNSQPDNITLRLGGNYPSGLATFIDFGADNFVISDGGRTFTVYNMTALGKSEYFVSVLAPEYDAAPKILTLNATSAVLARSDFDRATIYVTLPVSFSVFGWWALVLLVVASAAVFYIASGRRR